MNLSTSFAYPFADLSRQLPAVRFPRLRGGSVWGAVTSCFASKARVQSSPPNSENKFGSTRPAKRDGAVCQSETIGPSTRRADVSISHIFNAAELVLNSDERNVSSSLKRRASSDFGVVLSSTQETSVADLEGASTNLEGRDYSSSSSMAQAPYTADVCWTPTAATGSVVGSTDNNQQNIIQGPVLTLQANPENAQKISVAQLPQSLSHCSSRATVSTIQFSTESSLSSSTSTIPAVHICEEEEILDAQDMIVFDDTMKSSTYRVGEELGEGGYGTVYKATDDDGRIVALKVIEIQMLQDEEDQLMVRQEAAVQSALCIPETLQLFGVVFDASRVFYVMELAPMGDLRCYLNGIPTKKVPERYAARVTHGVTRALFVIHGRQLMHRDVKPGNILLDIDGSPKLGDFGLCVSVCREGGVCENRGTRAYTAPEVDGKTAYGCAVDMWSLGVTTFELLHGYRPFENAKSGLRKGKGKIVLAKSETVSTEATDFIECLLHPNPTERLTAAKALHHPWFQQQLGLVYY